MYINGPRGMDKMFSSNSDDRVKVGTRTFTRRSCESREPKTFTRSSCESLDAQLSHYRRVKVLGPPETLILHPKLHFTCSLRIQFHRLITHLTFSQRASTKPMGTGRAIGNREREARGEKRERERDANARVRSESERE